MDASLAEQPKVVAEWKKHRPEVWDGKGCPLGGVLSPKIWCLVVDRLLRLLNEAGFFTGLWKVAEIKACQAITALGDGHAFGADGLDLVIRCDANFRVGHYKPCRRSTWARQTVPDAYVI